MSATLRVFRLEATELAPFLVPLLVIAALFGVGNAPRPLVSSTAQDAFCWFAAAIGLTQGLLDRRFRSNLFLRHRPVSRARLQGARALAGVLAILGVAGAYLLTRWAVQSTMSGEDVWTLRSFWEQAAAQGAGRGFLMWMIWGDLLARMFLLWSALRFAVSTRGLVAPVILAPLLTVCLVVATNMGAFRFAHVGSAAAAVGVAGVLSIYQGARA